MNDSTPFAGFVDDYLDSLFQWDPTLATSAGIHNYDSHFPNLDTEAQRRRIAHLGELSERLRKLTGAGLSEPERTDADIIGSRIRAELLELEGLESWRRNPIPYFLLFGGAADGIIKREFAPAGARLRHLTDRLRRFPEAVAAMRENITNPPPEFTELAIRVAAGSLDFFGETLAAWARQAGADDATALAEFQKVHPLAADAMAAAKSWLETEVAPRSTGAFAIGAQRFADKLLHDEMVDIPLAELLAIGEANLERDYRDFVETAARIDSSRTPGEVMRALSDERPDEDDLLPSAERTMEGIIGFIEERGIVSIPSPLRPRIVPTPPYFRFGVFAAMDTPGAFEVNAREAYYYITPPESDWDAKHKDEHLRLFNRPVMEIITIHEAYPGHYIQFLNATRVPTRTRKVLDCYSNAEGWAHYTEQMMLETGYGDGDLGIRLAQLQEALLRDCRWVVGMRLHTAGMTLAEGARFFVEKGFQEPANAFEEARRGTFDPTYMAYSLGKLQLYKLRDDYFERTGSTDLGGFHDAFVRLGRPPFRMARRSMLGGDETALLYDASFYERATSRGRGANP